jgi:hypothetical protein
MRSHRFIGLGANVDDDHPSIVFAISCNVGYPDPNPYGNLGIDMLTLPGWGPSAGVVSSARPAAVSGDWKAEGGGTEQICYDFNRYVIAESERVGDALYDGKFYATENYGWDHVYEYMNLYNFNLFGDPALAVGGAAAGVAAGGWGRPAVTLDAVYPNPSASSMSVRFSLAVSGRVLATVHDVRGREVARLIDGLREAGIHAVTWNATGEGGQRLAPGVFFVAVEAGGHKACRKAVVLSR